jgi:prepilin-type processing-associated H-X9-DG protein
MYSVEGGQAGGPQQPPFTIQPPMGTFCGGSGTQGCGDGNKANSPHTGGIQVALGDGSVRFVSGEVSPNTWWAAITPAGGETLANDW